MKAPPSELPEAYPLQWPQDWPRTPPHRRKPSLYKVDFAKARDELLLELERMGARYVVISSNVPTRRDGNPYARQREPEDPGVAVYWFRDATPQVIACDQWQKVRENLRAVGLSVSALRQLQRTGASQIFERAFQGFNRLPQQTDWRTVLGFPAGARPDSQEINRAYRERAKRAHPDRGGSHQEIAALNVARDAALAEIQQRGGP